MLLAGSARAASPGRTPAAGRQLQRRLGDASGVPLFGGLNAEDSTSRIKRHE